MTAKHVSPIIRRLGQIVIIAALYYLTARLGLLVALPPGNVTALWPPSGLALAAVLMWGWPMGIGIFAGSFIVNFGALNGATTLPVSAAIATGSTLQAWVAAWLIRRFIKTLPPITVHHTLLAIGILSVTTLLAPAAGVTSLCLAGLAPWSDYPTLAWTWWLGDFVGILVFAPVLVVLSLRWRKQKAKEPFLWPLTGLIIGSALFTFFVIQHTDQQRLNDTLQRDVAETARVFKNTIDHYNIESITAIRAFYEASEEVTRAEFSAFTVPFLADFPTITALSWASHVTQAERPAFERSIREEGFPDFALYERDTDGNTLPAAERSEYFPVTFIEPFAPNRLLMGFDNASDPARLAAVIQARDSGEPAITAPLRLIQATREEIGILFIMPVYQNEMPIATLEERRANLRGLAVGAVSLDDLVGEALKSGERHDIEFYFYDVENPAAPQFLAFYPSLSGAQSLPIAGAPAPAALQTGMYQSVLFNVGDRDWLMVAHPGPAYRAGADRSAAWLFLLVGVTLAGGFLAYVSSRQKSEAAIARSEAEYRALSDYALTGVARIELSGKILYVNEAAAQMLGLASPDTVLQTSIQPYLSDGAQLQGLMDALRSSRQVRNQEVDILTTQGEKRHLLYSASLYKNVISLHLMDITKRIRADKEIRQLSRIVSQMADTVVITDINGVIEYVNPAFEQLSGFSLAEAQGKTPRILKSGQHSQEFYQQFWDAILHGEIFQGEMINRKKNGELYYETKTITPIRDAHGVMTHFVATGKDVTEQKEAEIAMRAAQRELEEVNRDLERRVAERTTEVRDLYDNAPTGYHSLDADGHYIMINQTELKWLGYTREEMSGRPLQDFLTAESQAAFRSKFPAFREHGEIRDLEFDFVRKDGSVLPVVINATAVYDDQSNYVMSRSTMLDITERKKAEAALRDSRDKLSAANAALERASRLKDEFLASMSHELRTPLTGILGLSEALQLQTLGALNKKQLKSLKNIESSGRHLLELINDILDLSKIEAGKLDMQLESCPAADICQASLQLVQGMAHQKKQNVSFSMNPASITLRADARRLKQMLVNLLSNAVKFAPEGGRLGLEVQVNEAEQNVVFCVWDKGIGIKPDELSKLFKPFVQLDSSLTRQYAGTGLGLSLVQRMAEMHGGGVKVESVPGEGSRFSIVLPWSEPTAQLLPDLIQPVPDALQPALVIENNEVDADQVIVIGAGVSVPLVMLADDSELILAMLSDFLKSKGYRVIATRSGLELLERATELHPEMILVDIQMPGMDGLETIRRLRTHSDPVVAATPMIAITALAISGDRERCLQAGANEYMSKPIPMAQLVEEIKTLLKKEARQNVNFTTNLHESTLI